MFYKNENNIYRKASKKLKLPSCNIPIFNKVYSQTDEYMINIETQNSMLNIFI